MRGMARACQPAAGAASTTGSPRRPPASEGQGAHRVADLGAVVGDEHGGDARLTGRRLEAGDDVATPFVVEGRGRLVSEDHDRVAHQGSGDAHPLLLAAGELRRPGVHPSHARPSESSSSVARSRAADGRVPAMCATSSSCSSAVSEGNRFACWNTSPIAAPRSFVRCALAERGDVLTVDGDGPRGRGAQEARHGEQRRLARPRGADDRDDLAARGPPARRGRGS